MLVNSKELLKEALKDVDNDWYEFDVINIDLGQARPPAYYAITNDNHTASLEKFNGYKRFLEGKEEFLFVLNDSTTGKDIYDEKKMHCVKNREIVKCILHDKYEKTLKTAYLRFDLHIKHSLDEYETEDEYIDVYGWYTNLKETGSGATIGIEIPDRCITVYRHRKYKPAD